ncbi:hypothetical protein EDD85DRAFT_792784 [Armillaria nabsnona]|nr:hypothetical protein EDD85DRAFT_792784 [Armillaria nabsnona]
MASVALLPRNVHPGGRAMSFFSSSRVPFEFFDLEPVFHKMRYMHSWMWFGTLDVPALTADCKCARYPGTILCQSHLLSWDYVIKVLFIIQTKIQLLILSLGLITFGGDMIGLLNLEGWGGFERFIRVFSWNRIVFWNSTAFSYNSVESIVPIPRQIQEFAFPDVVVTWCFPCITPLPLMIVLVLPSQVGTLETEEPTDRDDELPGLKTCDVHSGVMTPLLAASVPKSPIWANTTSPLNVSVKCTFEKSEGPSLSPIPGIVFREKRAEIAMLEILSFFVVMCSDGVYCKANVSTNVMHKRKSKEVNTLREDEGKFKELEK